MANTQVLLREDIDNLGARGEIVKVRAGYARNYLLPRKLAVQATASNVKQIEQERAALLRKEATERSAAEAQAAQMNSLRLTFERKVGEHGMLYGSVTSMDVQEALKEKGYEFDRRRIHLAEAIKETGEFSVRVRLHREVNVEIPVIVSAEGGAPAAAAEATAAPEATADATGADAATDASTEAAGAGDATAGDE
ncbi:MAG TPA: 50S ribosomal protein L9 [Pyrinomonadaceae bacterium]|jgi:large subunit ribosomal protein L9